MVTPKDDAHDHADDERDDASNDARFTTDPGDANQDGPSALAEALMESADLKDQLQRMAAEMANVRKRMLRDAENGRRLAQRDLVRALLPSIDNLERALDAAPEGAENEAVTQGVRMVHSELLRALKDFKIEVISPDGSDRFDPNLHEAVMRQPKAGVPENTILTVFEKGYRLEELVIRPARVILSAAPVAGADEGSGNDAERND